MNVLCKYSQIIHRKFQELIRFLLKVSFDVRRILLVRDSVSVAIRGAAVGPSGRRAAPQTAFGPGGRWGFRPSGRDSRRGSRDRIQTVPRYRLRSGLVNEGCVRRGRPGGPAGAERRRIGCQPPRGGPGSGPATFGKGAAADDVLRWFVVSRDGTGTCGSGFLPSQGTLTAGNVRDGLPSMFVLGTRVSSRFRGPVSRGEGGRRVPATASV